MPLAEDYDRPDPPPKEKLQNQPEQKQNPTPAPASETTPRSRALTSYIILGFNEDQNAWIRIDVGMDESGEVSARTPEAAMDACAPEVSAYERVAAVPSSSWHEFEKTTAFKRR